jgi:tetratricopeptide (TPR) repeat protein
VASIVVAGLLGVVTFRRNQSYRTALTVWQDVVARAPHNWRGHLGLGSVLREADRLDEAASALQRSIELFPRPLAYLQLGIVEEKRQYLDLALAAYDKAEALGPTERELAETLLRRGVLRLKSGDLERALGDLERSFALEPKSEAKINLGVIALRREAWSEAEAHFRAALELAPEDPAAHGGLGRALFQQQRHGEALAELELALLEQDSDPNLPTLVGATLCALDRSEEALAHFARALEAPPDSAEEHFNLARALDDLGRHDEAAREARRAVALAPGQPLLLELLARALVAKADATAAERSEALASALEAARLTAHSKPRLLETLARAHAASGDPARARETLEHALALAPPSDVELRQRLEARLGEYRTDAER